MDLSNPLARKLPIFLNELGLLLLLILIALLLCFFFLFLVPRKLGSMLRDLGSPLPCDLFPFCILALKLARHDGN